MSEGFCGLCKVPVENWEVHTKSEEHIRNDERFSIGFQLGWNAVEAIKRMLRR